MVPCSRRRLLRGGAVVGGLSVAGCFGMGGYDCETGRSKHNRNASLSEAATWPTFRHDAKNTGYNPDASVPDEVSVRWRYTACAEVDSGAAIAGGRVYPGGAILRGHDGTSITGEWSGYFRTPTIADGTIYGAANELTASATADGSERWRFRTRKVEFGDYSRFGVAVGPVLVDDLVFLATKASDLYALGEATAGGSATETTAG